MRVAMVDPSLFTQPYDDHLCRALHEAGHAVTLYTRPLRADETPTPYEYWKAERFYRVSEARAARALPGAVRLAFKGVEHAANMASLLADLRTTRPDVVHFQWMPVPPVDRLFLPLLRRVAPVLLTVHDTGGFLAPTSKLQLVGWRDLLAAVDHIVVHLEASKAALVEQGVAPGRIAVIPHGVLDVGGSATKVARSRPVGGDRVVLLLGTIKHYKGADILVRAFAALPPERRATVRLRIVGQPFIDIDALRALAARLGVAERIDWDLRFVDDAEIPGLLADADVFAFPYRRIDASGVLMTALPHERPVVATRVGCFAELLRDGETAFLADSERPEDFARALDRALANEGDAERVAAAARRLAVEQLSWSAIAGRTVEVYRQVVVRRAGGTAGAGSSAD
jgi:glycosyltransferase involved in cell wall biosynthesis